MKSLKCFVHRSSLYHIALTLFFLTNLSSAASAHRRQYEDAPVRGDYASLLKNHVTWNKLPVTIYFVPDAEYTAAREKAARKGIDVWVQATDGFVGYKVVDDPDRAQITVRFDPTNDDGHTTTSFTSRRIVHARIMMGVEQGSERDLQCTAAHEFGHALGLSGHSSQSHDLMYPMHIMGRAWSITRRDLNTLALLYHIDPDVAAAWTPQTSGLYRYAPRRYRRQESSDGDYPGAAG